MCIMDASTVFSASIEKLLKQQSPHSVYEWVIGSLSGLLHPKNSEAVI